MGSCAGEVWVELGQEDEQLLNDVVECPETWRPGCPNPSCGEQDLCGYVIVEDIVRSTTGSS